MRIKLLVLFLLFFACFGCAPAQQMDTFYVVSQYRLLLSDECCPRDTSHIGNFPMQVYLPNNQQVTLFPKALGEKQPHRSKQRKLHSLRIIKPHNNLFMLRIVTRDSLVSRRMHKRFIHYVAVDTTLAISEVPFNRNIIMMFYHTVRRSPRLMITNSPNLLQHIPSKPEKRRRRYLNRYYSKGIQYEYHADTGQLTQLYQ
jgi:hypothetical protein